MAKAAVRSKVVVLLLLLVGCLVCFPLVVGVLYLSLLCCALPCVLSSFAIILKRKSESWLFFSFIVLWMSRYCKCSVTLPYGAVGRSALCDCGIS